MNTSRTMCSYIYVFITQHLLTYSLDRSASEGVYVCLECDMYECDIRTCDIVQIATLIKT